MTAAFLPLVTRLPVATVLALAGLGKPVGFARSAERLWIPGLRNPGAGARRGLLGAAIGVELGGALLLLAAPGALAAPVAGTLILVLTSYGLASVGKVGTCGCWGGAPSRPTSRRALLGRNLTLLGLAMAGYPTPGLADGATLTHAAPILGFLPLVMLSLVSAVGAVPVRRLREPTSS